MNNLMDRYRTPEEYIRSAVLANLGTDSIATKADLTALIVERDQTEREYSKMTKAELYDLLAELMGDSIYTHFPVGVSSHAFQQKFNITHKDVQKMEKKGFIRATGEVRFRAYGQDRYAKTYDPYAYYRLTPAEIHAWLEKHQSTRKTKEGNNHV